MQARGKSKRDVSNTQLPLYRIKNPGVSGLSYWIKIDFEIKMREESRIWGERKHRD